jgi:hypothetical protein
MRAARRCRVFPRPCFFGPVGLVVLAAKRLTVSGQCGNCAGGAVMALEGDVLCLGALRRRSG